MDFLADFHIHSRFSRATSRDLDLKSLHRAAQEKGITVVGTGDFTHPAWMGEIRESLVEAEEGLFRLRPGPAREAEADVPGSCRGKVRFLLTVEISSIYKRDGQVRKVHNLIFAPTLECARSIAGRLERIGNIASDGRPILGLDSRDLLEVVREASPEAFLVPAHIWTPWFSVLGSRSGFDSLEACFGDLAGEIFCVETGLSSDPSMNWRLSSLDRYTLISNSDAHSADKLGREANRFRCGLGFPEIRQALRRGGEGGLLGTVEFFPEQGKYHLDGHRKCRKRMTPSETLGRGGLCPVCGKHVTVGVMHRVERLADRPEGARPERALPYERLISLAEAAGEARGAGPNTVGVRSLCRRLLERLGPEMEILARVPLEDVRREGGELLAEGLRRMRAAEVLLEAGYDGEFGVVHLFRDGERDSLRGQGTLVDLSGLEAAGGKRARRTRGRQGSAAAGAPAGACEAPAPCGQGEAPEATVQDEAGDPPGPSPEWDAGGGTASSAGGGREDPHPLLEGLNLEQREAVLSLGAPLLIVAGPGTGKTHTLTRRIAWMVRELGVPAERVLAVTFTQRAAREMEERLAGLAVREANGPRPVRVRTFHGLGADLLRDEGQAFGVPRGFQILGREDSLRLLRGLLPAGARRAEAAGRSAERVIERISLAKKDLLYPGDGGLEEAFPERDLLAVYERYQGSLASYGALDYDDLVSLPVRAMDRSPPLRQSVRDRFRAVFVDEYQDVNLAQYRFLKHLCANPDSLCAIGDPHQAIYGFRGASPLYFLRFEEDFPGARRIRLLRNYRSTETILSASVRMISRGLAAGEAPPQLVAAGDRPSGGPRIRMAELATEKAEAIFIAQTIEGLLGGTAPLSLYAGRVHDTGEPWCTGFGDVAVLYRLNALGPGVEQALRHQGIPCQGAAQSDRWEGQEGRALLALVRWMSDPGDRLSLERIRAAVSVPAAKLLGDMERYRRERVSAGASLGEWLSGLAGLDWLPLGDPGWKDPWELLVRAASGRQDGDAAGLVRSLSLWQGSDLLDRKAEKVTLATLHAAKGLEFSVVFVAGCERGILPWEQGTAPPPDPAEERRLFFVGMTRARRLLFLTRARSRFLHGTRGSAGPSPFLADIPPDRAERAAPARAGRKPKARAPEQIPLFKPR